MIDGSEKRNVSALNLELQRVRMRTVDKANLRISLVQ